MISSREYTIDGVLISLDSVSRDGETQGYANVVCTLEQGTVDIRLDDRNGTIWMLPLAKLEDALAHLKAVDRERMLRQAAERD